MKREDVIKKVKVKLEEFSPFDEPKSLVAIADSNVKPINSYIDETLDTAYDNVLLLVPLHLVKENTTDIASSKVDVKNRVGYMDVPDDYLRLHSVMYDKWQRMVNKAIYPDQAEYALQRNQYTRGGFAKPVVAINNNKFELYSIRPTMKCECFKYIPKTTQGNRDFEDTIVDAVVMQCAILVLEVFEQANKAQMLSQELSNLINSYKV
jgi:hypothetical protein